MNRVFLAIALLVTLLAITGCYHAPVKPPVGYLFSEISAPVDTNAEGGELGPRVGRAESSCILGLFATGDCSVAAAVEDGEITHIQHIDYEFYNMCGVIQRFTTVVIGE